MTQELCQKRWMESEDYRKKNQKEKIKEFKNKIGKQRRRKWWI